MHSGELTQQQIDALKGRVLPSILLMRKLQERMTACDFPFNDRLRLRVLIALETLEALYEALEQLGAARVKHDDYFGGLKARDWKRQQRDRRNG